ncbi:MAG: YARHG domain-containing protein [Gelidibacter sp.]
MCKSIKKTIFFISIPLVLSSCLDHLLEPNKVESNVVSADDKNNKKSIEVDDRTVPVEKNSFGRYPITSQRLLTSHELQNSEYSSSDLSVMRNEIFARHGYKFVAGGEMDQYFKNQNWYQPKYNDVSSLLSKVEQHNVDLILEVIEAINNTDSIQDDIPQLEDEAGGYGDVLVENLRLRDKPALDGGTVALLKKGSFVNVKEESTFRTTIELDGREINDVWFKIISEEGEIGWVHGCCIDVTWP